MNKELRDIRIVFFIFSTFLGFFGYKLYPSIRSYILLTIAFHLLFILVFFPLTLKPIFRIWLKITKIIGKINTQILLGVVFFSIFVPTGLIMKLLSKDPMQRKKLKTTDSYWEVYTLAGSNDKSRYERQF